MPTITFRDGSHHFFDRPVSVLEVATGLGEDISRSVLAGKIDGRLVDLHFVLSHDTALTIVTDQDEEALEMIRHSAAHLLAQAVKILFPEAQVTIGPVIENGFYYDFSYHRPFTIEDLEIIEKKMAELAKANYPIERQEVTRDEAMTYFQSIGEQYKAEIIKSIPPDQVISLYKQGDFVDLCRGPHLPSTGRLTAFKLMKVAGAYWRGDSRNEMLQRIYGTAWARQEELDTYLHLLEEAEKRDHRRIGKQLHLFHMQDEAPGSVFWHPKGWTLFQTLVAYMRHRQDKAGYVEVNTPDIMDRLLWETSGHWSNYRDNMFTTETEDHRVFALKPMSCPGAVSLFSQGIKSYRDLPIKMSEFGKVHRYEPSGALHGLFRLRHFTQDDAHIFCTEAQMETACQDITQLILDIYRDFGFKNVQIKLSTRPAHRIGADEIWDKLEEALSSALKNINIEYTLMPGEGAFYGPKLDFLLRDTMGRQWQCGTLQVDMNLPERFDIHYIDEDNTKKRPLMLHRALFGSLERFIGILIEHYAGALPFWLAPVQAVVMNISEYQSDYAIKVMKELKDCGFRVECDLRNEKITYKIREHSLQRLPYQLIVGDREKEAGMVSVRGRASGDLGIMSVSALIERFKTHCFDTCPN